MNSNLKTMRVIGFIWGGILVIIIFALTIFGFKYNEKINKYEELETKLETAVKQYVDQKFLYPELNNSIKIKFQEIKDEKILEELKTDNDECDGYVVVKNNKDVFEYHTYIRCNDYKTKNYDKN